MTCFLFYFSCCHVEPLLRTLISVRQKRGSPQRDWERARKKENKKERRRKKRKEKKRTEQKRKERKRKEKKKRKEKRKTERKKNNERKTDRKEEKHKKRKEEGNQKQVLGSAHGKYESYSGYQIILGINHS